MTAQPPAPPEHPAGGAGLPAHVYDALHALADRMDETRAEAEHWEKHWRSRRDPLREGVSAGRVRQLADDSAAVRNLANDLLKET